MSIQPAQIDSELVREANETYQNVMQKVVGEGPGGVDGDHDLPGLSGRIIEAAGDMEGKPAPNSISLSTHILNTIAVGVSSYVYDRIVRQQGDVDIEEVSLLVPALTLHDCNKYIENNPEYDVAFDTEQNTNELLTYYFDQGDDFGLIPLLPADSEKERELRIDDLKYLVQRTETNDTTVETKGESSRLARGLSRFCRIGDGFVSAVHHDGVSDSLEWIKTRLDDGYTPDDDSHVQHLTFTGVQQSVTNNRLLEISKDIIRGEEYVIPSDDEQVSSRECWGLVVGTTPDSILYFGKEIPQEILRKRLITGFNHYLQNVQYEAKTEWNSFAYNVLDEIKIPFERKREVIARGYVEQLKRDKNGIERSFERVPDFFREWLPELTRVVYDIRNCPEDLREYPSLNRLWMQLDDGDEYNGATIKMGFFCETLRRVTGGVDDGYSVKRMRAELEELKEDVQPELRDDLEVDDGGGVEDIVDRYLETDIPQPIEIPSTTRTCFLCGRPADNDYEKGNKAFYSGRGYDKRVGVEQDTKKICSVCNLEHALLRDVVSDHFNGFGDNIKTAFVYYDSFLADLSVEGSENASGLVRELHHSEHTDTDDTTGTTISDPRLIADSFSRQYHIQPLYIDSEDKRLGEIWSLLETLVQRGFKVQFRKPFSEFTRTASLFCDRNPTRRQVMFGADRVESYDDLHRLTRLFELLDRVAHRRVENDARRKRKNIDAFTAVSDASFDELAAYVVTHTDRHDYERQLAHRHFMKTENHKHEYEGMREVARRGIELYGYERGSRHKKLKLVRLALDHIIDGLNRGKRGDSLLHYVSGQVYKTAVADADRDYYINTDEAETFVVGLFDYIEESYSEIDKQTVSGRMETILNEYLFSYDQLLNEGYDVTDSSDGGSDGGSDGDRDDGEGSGGGNSME